MTIPALARFEGFNSMLSQKKNSLPDTIIKMIQRVIFHLSLRMKEPIIFMPPKGGLSAYGYEATTLIDACQLLLQANDKDLLFASQAKYAAAAEIVVRSFAKVGIIAVIDEVTGYQGVRPQDALHVYLQKLIRNLNL